MPESPTSLQELCLDFICDNVLALCEVQPSDCGGAGEINCGETSTAFNAVGKFNI